MSFKQITIIGTGLIGGSFALAAKEAGFPGCIIGCDRRAVMDRALAMGVIDEAVEDPAASVQGSDLILLATPVGAIIDLIERIGPVASPDALITDVGSTKREILDRAYSVFGDQVSRRFLAGHPMAGKEHSGIEHAEAAMLRNKAWFIVPRVPQDLEQGKNKDFLNLLQQAGLRIVVVSAERHDRICGWISHLPQMVSTAMAGVLLDEFGGDPELHNLGSRGLFETTRTAASPYSMWRDVALTNTENLERALSALEQRLAHIRENLRSPALREAFEYANRFAAPRTKPAASVLVLPGWQDSGPQHWQTIWEQAEPAFRRVQQKDWNTPRLSDWIEGISTEVARAQAPIVFAAHSLGCIALAHWANGAPPDLLNKIKGALLAAPADAERPAFPEEIKNFAPVPRGRLPFPSIVVASSDDPYLTMERGREFAKQWGSRFEDIGAAGHISAGLGDWPEGKRLLRNLIEGN
jgi:prephenate dehydrogenase